MGILDKSSTFQNIPQTAAGMNSLVGKVLDKLGFRKKKDEPVKQTPKQQTPVAAQPVAKKSYTGAAADILLRPLVSEKAMGLAPGGKYVFVVHPRANKSEIRKSIQKIYDVHVIAVKIVMLPGKKRRYGRAQGKTSAIKKALVTLRAGEKIPGIIEQVG